MRKNWKQATAFLCAMILMASVVGCASGNTGVTPPQTESSQPAAASTTEATGDNAATETDELAPFGKYKETVTLTRAQMTASATQWENGDDAQNNPWTRAALEEFNINLVDDWAADGSQYVNKINLSIASQTLPDVFWADCNQFSQLVKSGMTADLTVAYEQTASPMTKQLMDADSVTFDSAKVDGQLMGLPTQHFGIISQMNTVWVRDDWMAKLGLTEPKTMDDLINICEQFVKNDPDGNGADDTYGLAVDKTLVSLYNLMAAYHANPRMWLEKNGQIEYGTIQPEVKTALTAFQDMFNRGIISKEFAVKDAAKVTEDLVSGKVGVAIWGSSFGYHPNIDIVKNSGTEATFSSYAIPSSDGAQVKLSIDWPVGNYIVVNKNCKNPEAAIKMVNLYAKVLNEGTQEERETYVNYERSWGAIPFQVQNAMADYNQYVAISAAQDSRDTTGMTVDQLGKYEKVIDWIDNKTPNSLGEYLQVSKVGAYGVTKPFVDNGWYVRTKFQGVSTPTMVQKNASLKTLEDESITKIIMGEPIDSFDTFVEQWKSLGGNDITREMNEALGNQ